MDHTARELLRYFDYEHLPAGPLRETSQLFYPLATKIAEELPPIMQTTLCLQRLMEAKDCAVRAALDL